ncbi:hypothetical protein EBM89_19705 [Cellulomonas triticagri]|uniref:Uncharacterized protein n=1 Tax=Cellulomonas triticagri TaxID=2483352 RepID=A0A3M2ISL2_9CELL|nr:hypothetical protein EBM89_19705 [Cellulomonas triticagri]
MGAVSHEDRIARARAALAHAELRTGARVVRPAPAAPAVPVVSVGATALAAPDREARPVAVVTPAPAPAADRPGPVAVPDRADRNDQAGRDDRADRVDRPARPVAVPAPGAPTSGVRPARGPLLLTDRPPLAVPPALTPLLPDGLRRGSTTAVLGSTSLVLAMIAAACTAREAWAAVVGQPSLGLLAAAQTGVALERLAVVPRPGVEAPTVVAALLDGIDVVVVGPGAHLADADRRRLMARARDRGSVLLSTAPWPGAGTVLTVEGGRWSGVGEGDGRLRAHELHLTRTGRGSAGQAQDLRVVLPLEVGTDPYGIPAAPAPAPAARRTGLRLVG